MPKIRPVSDLRNNFADISRFVHETAEPVFLTKNGYGDMVVMSMEAFERPQFESEVFLNSRRPNWKLRQLIKDIPIKKYLMS